MYELHVFIRIARELTDSVRESMETSPQSWGGAPDLGFVLEADQALNNTQTDSDIRSWVAKYGVQLGFSLEELEDVCTA